jgi:hypothetical protein
MKGSVIVIKIKSVSKHAGRIYVSIEIDKSAAATDKTVTK